MSDNYTPNGPTSARPLALDPMPCQDVKLPPSIGYVERPAYDAAMAISAEYAAHIAALKAEVARLQLDKAFIMDERDRTFALMLQRAEKAEAEADRLRAAMADELEHVRKTNAALAAINAKLDAALEGKE